jgi:hypothetical protein
MAVSDELSRFVREALAQGHPRTRIEEELLRAGWDREQVADALGAWVPSEFPLPVPRPRAYLSARETFLYLVLFTTLYISAINLGTLFFQLIDAGFPDPSERNVVLDRNSLIRWAVASLVVAFPVFLALTRAMQRAIARDPVKRGSKVRKWLTYLTLFVAATVLIGDVIALVNGLLSGEMTTRFALKVLVVLGIAGLVFGYYLWDLRSEEQEGPR